MSKPILYSLTRLIALFVLGLANIASAEVHHAQGEMAGEVTANSVLLQSRLTTIPGPEPDATGDLPGATGVACFEWSPSPDFDKANRTGWLKAAADHDFIVREQVTGLQPGTRYYYRLIFGESKTSTRTGPVRQFRTLPEPDNVDANLSFIMGSCQNYAFFMYGKDGKGSPASEEDRRLGFPAYAAMLKLKPDFFIGTGDIVYYDHPAQTAAKSLPELRKKWHEQFRFPRMVDFFAQTPAFWSKDDHDFRFNDADRDGEKLPLTETGIEIFREQMPIHPMDDTKTPTYRTHRVHQHLQLWFVEGRDFRSPNKSPDGPDKSIWGTEQREWLERTLRNSDATWKIIITPTPMVGPDSKNKKDNHTNLGGFRHEANEFFKRLQQDRLTNVLTFCGDRHWQYHSIHPLGVEEFSCGALNDENAIRGISPGNPQSTDPQGLIRQPFLYPNATGGFLHITINKEAQLVITHYDDEGTVMNKVHKKAK
ncbi:MAG: alkaline phosphatase D family protein [Planctomycetaceae bacterium]